jgi:chromosome segregation ATPase
MAQTHPIGEHEARLKDLERHRADAQVAIASLESRCAEFASKIAVLEEKTKTINDVLAEIKGMLKDYTTEMKKAMGELKKNIDELKFKPAKYWQILITAVITGGVGFAIAKLLV